MFIYSLKNIYYLFSCVRSYLQCMGSAFLQFVWSEFLTGGWTSVPCTARQLCNHLATRDVPHSFFNLLTKYVCVMLWVFSRHNSRCWATAMNKTDELDKRTFCFSERRQAISKWGKRQYWRWLKSAQKRHKTEQREMEGKGGDVHAVLYVMTKEDFWWKIQAESWRKGGRPKQSSV